MSRSAVPPSRDVRSPLFKAPQHAQASSGGKQRGRARLREAQSGSRGAAPLVQPASPAAEVRSSSITRLMGPFATSPGSPQSLSSPPSSTGTSPRRAVTATSSSAVHRIGVPTGVPLAGSSANLDRAPSARPDHPARSPQSRSTSARGSPLGLGDTAFLFRSTEFGGWVSPSRSASGSRPDVGRRSASAGIRPSQGGDRTPSPLGSVGSLFGGSPRGSGIAPMQSVMHSPLSGSGGSPPPMGGYRSASPRSSSLMSVGGLDREFDVQATTARQRSLSSSSTRPDVARRSASAPPMSSPLRQPPVTPQGATRASMRLQQQQQQRSTSSSRLPSAPSHQPPPTRSSAAPSDGSAIRRPAPSSSSRSSPSPPGHETKKARHR